MPAVPYSALPAWANECDVLVMPYADLPVTRLMQPLKMLEYLATGKPVVVRNLPATSSWSDCMDLAGSAEEFASMVEHRLATGISASQTLARTRLAAHSWGEKAAELERIVVRGLR